MERELSAQLARITDPDPLVRQDAARRLGSLDSSGATALVAALGDREWRVRAAAAESLGQLGHRQAVFPLCQQLSHSRSEVRRAAITALESIGDGDATASLIMALDDERDGETRRMIARALGRLGDDRALAPLQRLTGDPHWAVRREAAAAAERLIKRRTA